MMTLIFLVTGILGVVLTIAWDRHHEARLERNRSGWLASFYEAPTSKEPRR